MPDIIRTTVTPRSEHIKLGANLQELYRLQSEGDPTARSRIDAWYAIPSNLEAMKMFWGANMQADMAQHPEDYGGAPPAYTKIPGGPIVPGEPKREFISRPATNYAEQATGDGTVTYVVEESGQGVWLNVGASPGSFPNDPTRTSYGTRSTSPLPIKAGEWLTVKQEKPEPINGSVYISTPQT